MCGIIGYIGHQPATPILINGLRRLEYRGYDSAGVALLERGKLAVTKRAGKVEQLACAVDEAAAATAGIAHTRWATHGRPTRRNAHPHTSGGRVAVVHNGIVENYAELKAKLQAAGYRFTSQTDSEVLAHLIDHKLASGGDVLAATTAALTEVVGTFGLAVVCREQPDQLIAARRGSPLLIGLRADETYLASDATALVGHTDQVVYLEDDEVAVCTRGRYRLVDLQNRERARQSRTIELPLGTADKGGYDHFLLKEIMEQPQSVTDGLRGRLSSAEGISHLGGLNLTEPQLRGFGRLLVIGCGSAYYSGLVGKYLLERLTGLPVDVEFASEFRYRQPVLAPGTLCVLVSQSGETADTLAAMRELKRRGLPTLGLVNVVGSSLAREVDGGIYLHAGPEISVASTKAFTAQVVAQLLLGLKIARHRDLSLAEGQEIVAALGGLPGVIARVLESAPRIKAIAAKYAGCRQAMYLGRDSLYPVALEGAHKLKEISYVQAEAYPAGEMKHGANALIDEELLVVFLTPRNALYAKARSNLEEVRARGSQLIALGTQGDQDIAKLARDVITIPPVSPWIEPIVANLPLQLLAYYMAVERGTDVDQPRNLAKSVTVE
ncbi:glutamine--fructose-6-phosphate transaminase (isomerizing) [Candidatus Parcubacteria bacterium]|nr:glutamine--fructose-6-phosphate transaminase (isomerizing) [Candidatus Parcubacteria bacterium]